MVLPLETHRVRADDGGGVRVPHQGLEASAWLGKEPDPQFGREVSVYLECALGAAVRLGVDAAHDLAVEILPLRTTHLHELQGDVCQLSDLLFLSLRIVYRLEMTRF